MKSVKIYLVLSFLAFCLVAQLSAQVPKTVIVEHFTNSRCGICSFKNPDFYNNLNSQNGILHLAFHPSSPYSSCVFNQHNKSENDARTNFYGLYGSTPKFAIQGDPQPGNLQVGNPNIWTPYLNQTAPVSIEMEQEKSSSLIKAKITLTTEATHSLGTLNLFVALAEDTVFYNAPNGENLHFDVFRKALPNIDGFSVDLPQNVGESVSFEVEIMPDPEWNIDRIFTVAILQEDSKDVVQSAATSPDLNNVISNVKSVPTLENVQIAPNPTSGIVSVTLPNSEVSNIRVYSLLGSLIREKSFSEFTEVNLSEFPVGTFLIEIQNEQGRFLSRVVKVN